jgi:hypothetical protein
VTEAKARGALAAFDVAGGLEAWIAAQPWRQAPGGWVAPERGPALSARLTPRGAGGTATAMAGEPLLQGGD